MPTHGWRYLLSCYSEIVIPCISTLEKKDKADKVFSALQEIAFIAYLPIPISKIQNR